MASFSDRLYAAVERCGNPVMVGLDPRAESLPPGMLPAPGDLAEQLALAVRQTLGEEGLSYLEP